MSRIGLLGSPAANPMRLEEFRESWQRQLIADRRIPMSALKVGLAICWYLNRKKGWAWPSIGRLDKDTGLSSRTVIRAVKWLEAHRYVRVLRTCEGKRRQVNRYRPILKRPVPNVANVAKFEQRDDARCQEGGDKAVSVGSDKAMSHEPLKEPLNEPLIQYSPSTASVSSDANKEVGEEGLEARCY
jgi:hypothetical protein